MTPAEIARREVENGRRQFDLATEMIRTHLLPGRPFALRPGHILELQSIAVEGIEPSPGRYRSSRVGITGTAHQPPDPFLVPGLVVEMCDYVNDALHERSAFHLSAYVMWRHNWIHPFTDGNGRTSRVLSYIVLSLALGYELPGRPTVPEQIQGNRSGYFHALEAADRAERDGRTDVSAMEALIKGMLARQLLSVIDAAEGRES